MPLFAFSPRALVGPTVTEERATSKVPHSVEAWLMKEADVRYGGMVAALCEPWPKRGHPHTRSEVARPADAY